MLSGPPGRQNAQVSGTDDSKKCRCVAPGSSGIMKPWMRWVFWFRASCFDGEDRNHPVFFVLDLDLRQHRPGHHIGRAGSGAEKGCWRHARRRPAPSARPDPARGCATSRCPRRWRAERACAARQPQASSQRAGGAQAEAQCGGSRNRRINRCCSCLAPRSIQQTLPATAVRCSVDVFHAAILADGQAFASGLQFFVADLFFFARFQAFGGGLMGGGHGAVALDVFLGFLVGLLCKRY